MRYRWLHIPTGKQGFGVMVDNITPGRPIARPEALESINSWNRQQPTRWKYWLD